MNSRFRVTNLSVLLLLLLAAVNAQPPPCPCSIQVSCPDPVQVTAGGATTAAVCTYSVIGTCSSIAFNAVPGSGLSSTVTVSITSTTTTSIFLSVSASASAPIGNTNAILIFDATGCITTSLGALGTYICQPGNWFDTVGNTCSPCVTSCAQCASSTICSSCVTGYSPNTDNTQCIQNAVPVCDPMANCAGHGTCSSTGSCICNAGYAGTGCQACDTNYYNFPTCTFCNPTTTCNGNGICTASGIPQCTCSSNFTGPSCSSCSSGYYGYPNCMQCQDVIPHCQSCSQFGTSLTCGFCQTVPVPYYWDPIASQCKLCGDHCVSCMYTPGGSTCFTCAAGYWTQNGVCVNTCPIDTYVFTTPSGTTSSTTCLPCGSGAWSLFNSTSCNLCPQFPTAHYVKTGATTCTACDQGVLSSVSTTLISATLGTFSVVAQLSSPTDAATPIAGVPLSFDSQTSNCVVDSPGVTDSSGQISATCTLFSFEGTFVATTVFPYTVTAVETEPGCLNSNLTPLIANLTVYACPLGKYDTNTVISSTPTCATCPTAKITSIDVVQTDSSHWSVHIGITPILDGVSVELLFGPQSAGTVECFPTMWDPTTSRYVITCGPPYTYGVTSTPTPVLYPFEVVPVWPTNLLSCGDAIPSVIVTDCLAGQYGNLDGKCHQCNRGTNSNAGASSCFPCPSNCDTCTNSSFCTSCSLGYYSNSNNLCTQCPSPYGTTAPGATDVSACTCTGTTLSYIGTPDMCSSSFHAEFQLVDFNGQPLGNTEIVFAPNCGGKFRFFVPPAGDYSLSSYSVSNLLLDLDGACVDAGIGSASFSFLGDTSSTNNYCPTILPALNLATISHTGTITYTGPTVVSSTASSFDVSATLTLDSSTNIHALMRGAGHFQLVPNVASANCDSPFTGPLPGPGSHSIQISCTMDFSALTLTNGESLSINVSYVPRWPCLQFTSIIVPITVGDIIDTSISTIQVASDCADGLVTVSAQFVINGDQSKASGQVLTFSAAASPTTLTCTGTAGIDGTASCVLNFTSTAFSLSGHTLTVAFAGAGVLASSQSSATITLASETTTITFIYVPEIVLIGGTLAPSVKLKGANGELIPYQNITFTLGDGVDFPQQSCTGLEHCSISNVLQHNVETPLVASFAGSQCFAPATKIIEAVIIQSTFITMAVPFVTECSDTISLAGVLTATPQGTPLAGEVLHFSLNGSAAICSNAVSAPYNAITTDSNGQAICTVSFSQVGTSSLSIVYPGQNLPCSYGALDCARGGRQRIGTSSGSTSSASSASSLASISSTEASILFYNAVTVVVVGFEPTNISFAWTSPPILINGSSTTSDVKVNVTDEDGVPLVGQTVSISLGAQSCAPAVTDSNGIASCVIDIINQTPGSVSVVATYGGDGSCYGGATSISTSITVLGGVAIDITPPSSLECSDSASFAVSLTSGGGSVPLAAEDISLQFDVLIPVTCTTNGVGVATCVVPLGNTVVAGTYTVTASFAGDGPYPSTSQSATVTVSTDETVLTCSTSVSTVYNGASLSLSSSLAEDAGALSLAPIRLGLTLSDSTSINVCNITAPSSSSCSNTVSVSLSQLGPAVVVGTFAGTQCFAAAGCSSGSQTVTILQQTSITTPSVLNAECSDTMTVNATVLASPQNIPVGAGFPVTFVLTVPGSPKNPTCPATTDASGLASCQMSLAGHGEFYTSVLQGTYSLTASTPDDLASYYKGSSVTVSVAISADQPSLQVPKVYTAYNGQPFLATAQITEDTGAVAVAGKSLTYVIGSGTTAQTCTGSGQNCNFTNIQQIPAGTFPISISFAGDQCFAPVSTSSVVAVYQPTVITITGSGFSADCNDAVTVSATLLQSGIPGNPPAPNQILTFSLGTTLLSTGFHLEIAVQSLQCTATTDSTGLAQCQISLNGVVTGTRQLTVTFAPGSSSYLLASTQTSTVTVTPEDAALVYLGAGIVNNGSMVTFQAALHEDSATGNVVPTANSFNFTLGGSQSCQTGVTTSCSMVIAQPPGPAILLMQYPGSSCYAATTGIVQVIVKQPVQLAFGSSSYSVDCNDKLTVTANLTSPGAVWPQQPIRFTLLSQIITSITDVNGVATAVFDFTGVGTNTPVLQLLLAAGFAGNSTAYLLPAITITQPVTVQQEEDVLQYTGQTVLYNGHNFQPSALLQEDGLTPVSGRAIQFSMTPGPSCSGGITNAAGVASCSSPVTVPMSSLGPATVTSSFAGDTCYQPQSITTQVTIYQLTQVNYTGATQSECDQVITVSGILFAIPQLTPIANQIVTFNLTSQLSCQGVTNNIGVASCTITPSDTTITTRYVPVIVGFAPPSGSYLVGSSGTGNITVIQETSSLTYTGNAFLLVTIDNFFGNSGPGIPAGKGTVAAPLTPQGTPVPMPIKGGGGGRGNAVVVNLVDADDQTPIVGVNVTFTLGTGPYAASCSGQTGQFGYAFCQFPNISTHLPLCTNPLTISYGGSVCYKPAILSTFVTLFAFTSTFNSTSAFVIGDKEAVVGQQVEYYGAHWSKDNPMTGGSAPDQFKGWASLFSGGCDGGNFAANNGEKQDDNDKHKVPPKALPACLGVLVADSICDVRKPDCKRIAPKDSTIDPKTDSISGDYVEIAIVQATVLTPQRSFFDFDKGPASSLSGPVLGLWCSGLGKAIANSMEEDMISATEAAANTRTNTIAGVVGGAAGVVLLFLMWYRCCRAPKPKYHTPKPPAGAPPGVELSERRALTEKDDDDDDDGDKPAEASASKADGDVVSV